MTVPSSRLEILTTPSPATPSYRCGCIQYGSIVRLPGFSTLYMTVAITFITGLKTESDEVLMLVPVETGTACKVVPFSTLVEPVYGVEMVVPS